MALSSLDFEGPLQTQKAQKRHRQANWEPCVLIGDVTWVIKPLRKKKSFSQCYRSIDIIKTIDYACSLSWEAVLSPLFYIGKIKFQEDK